MSQEIVCNLWFNNNAQEAVCFYLSVFTEGKILSTEYYTESGEDLTGHHKGDILTIDYEIHGTHFRAINAGPEFQFTPAVSFSIECKDQDEIDYYWNRLSAVPEAEQCGWLQDTYGLSWQIVPASLEKMMATGTDEQRKNVTAAYLHMKKFNIAELEQAFGQ